MDHLNKRFNLDHVNKLMSNERYELLQPEKLIDNLSINENDVVADLGAGAGFFTIPAATQTNNAVYAIDIEPSMIQLLEEAASKQSISNINTIVSNLNVIPLADQILDKVISAFVLHEVDHLDTTIKEIARVTKHGGRIMLIDFKAIHTEAGPPLEIRIPSSKLVTLLKDHHFNNIITKEINDSNYMIIAERN
ncbi:class I SAM-dependent methyltransferase [Paraliobacillus salinarum]|uniref:class I SAM-dependent methyltransferase n=1 Tax=Paraliobacillus salinarum TaxID=1158996 RepID=UPI0015F61658|nr:methyltransferase domain-containing protein [Paraliobacillus salinarum]